MERFIEKAFPIWLMIHLGFICYQLMDSYVFNSDTAGQAPDYSVSIFDAAQQSMRVTVVPSPSAATSSPVNTNLNPTANIGTRLGRAMNDPQFQGQDLETVDDDSIFNFMLSLVCRVRSIGEVFRLLFSLFTLNYPFVAVFEQEGTIIRWVLDAFRYAGIISGAIFTLHLGLIIVRSGLIGALFTPAGLLAAGGIVVGGTALNQLTKTVLNCG